MLKKAGKISAFLIVFITAVCLAMQISVYAVNAHTHYVRPDCEKADLTCVLEKPALTEDDYALLFEQTGLTRTGVDRCIERGEEGVRKILAIQKNYFGKHEVYADYFAPFCSANRIGRNAEACYLEEGDVIITSCTQVAGVKIGHAGLVTAKGILCAVRYGVRSGYSPLGEFTGRPAFAVLSPVADSQTKKQVAQYATENLSGKRYGILSGKSVCNSTQCAHLVWYAYNKFGIDLDANGGSVVTPKDIFLSDKVRVVQIFGYSASLNWV